MWTLFLLHEGVCLRDSASTIVYLNLKIKLVFYFLFCFSEGKYDNALNLYTMAIELNPKVPAYYGNRSFCYIKTEYYGYALEDANKAIELDKKYIKVRLYLQYLVNNHGIQSEEQVRLLIAKSCLQEVT